MATPAIQELQAALEQHKQQTAEIETRLLAALKHAEAASTSSTAITHASADIPISTTSTHNQTVVLLPPEVEADGLQIVGASVHVPTSSARKRKATTENDECTDVASSAISRPPSKKARKGTKGFTEEKARDKEVRNARMAEKKLEKEAKQEAKNAQKLQKEANTQAKRLATEEKKARDANAKRATCAIQTKSVELMTSFLRIKPPLSTHVVQSQSSTNGDCKVNEHPFATCAQPALNHGAIPSHSSVAHATDVCNKVPVQLVTIENMATKHTAPILKPLFLPFIENTGKTWCWARVRNDRPRHALCSDHLDMLLAGKSLLSPVQQQTSRYMERCPSCQTYVTSNNEVECKSVVRDFFPLGWINDPVRIARAKATATRRAERGVAIAHSHSRRKKLLQFHENIRPAWHGIVQKTLLVETLTNAQLQISHPAANVHAAASSSLLPHVVPAEKMLSILQPLRLSFLRWPGVSESVLNYSDPDSDDEWNDNDNKSDGEQLGSSSDMDSDDDHEEKALRDEEERMRRMGKLRKDGLEHADFLESDDIVPMIREQHANMLPIIVGPVLNLDKRVNAYFATKRLVGCASTTEPLTCVVLTDDERELMQYRIRLLQRQQTFLSNSVIWT